MNGLRKLFLGFSVFMFVLTLLIVNLVWTVNNTVTRREVVMGWINNSGFYDNIVDELVKMTEDQLQKEQNQNLDNTAESKVETALMIRAAKKVFTPDNIQEKLETVLSGTYDWLEGDTPNLQFALDLTDEKAAFAESLGEEATLRAVTLPDCTQDQIAVAQESDALSIQCKPPEFEALVAKFKQEFANSDEFLQDTVITGDDLKSENNGVEQPITQTVSDVPSWYQFARTLIWFMLLAAVIWGLLVLFLSKNLRYGVKHIAVAFLIAGIMVAISAAITSQVTEVVKVSDSSQEIAVALVRESTKTISRIGIIVATVYLGLFAILMLYLYLTKPKTKEVVEVSEAVSKPTTENTPEIPPIPAKPESTIKKTETPGDKSNDTDKKEPTSRG